MIIQGGTSGHAGLWLQTDLFSSLCSGLTWLVSLGHRGRATKQGGVEGKPLEAPSKNSEVQAMGLLGGFFPRFFPQKV